MSRIMRTVTIPETTTEREIGRVCDFPGCKTHTNEEGSYEVNLTDIRVVVKQREGEQYPSGGMGRGIEIDICPECFKGKLVPWLRSQGVVVDQKEWDN